MEQPGLIHNLVGGLTEQNPSASSQTHKPVPASPTYPRHLRAFGKRSKIPRPPNAFILYRAQLHPHMKQHNPELHNNEISKALGKRWKGEPEEVKEKYKQMALEVKARHTAEYPDYQYAPRKAGEKKRRMTARKLERLRESQNVQETSNFPSSDAIITASLDAQASPESAAEPITYQQNDTFTSTLPTSFDNIEDEISRECGAYGANYSDLAYDMEDIISSPENHLLQASQATHATALQNSWETMIDWQGLGNAVTSAQHMTVDPDDLSAVQASGPDGKHKSDDEASISFSQNMFGNSNYNATL